MLVCVWVRERERKKGSCVHGQKDRGRVWVSSDVKQEMKEKIFTEGYEGSLQNIRVTKFAEPSNDPNLVALRTILFPF